MKKSLTVLLIGISFLSFAQQKNILFIGNSYTYSNDLPSIVKEIALSNNQDVFIASHSMGGATFQQHSANPTVMNLINAKNWDYILIQGQSQEPSFPDSQVNTQSIPYLKKIADTVYANHFCTDLQLFMTWGKKDGDSQWAPISTYDGMQTRLYNGYMRMADSVAASVSPVGQVWRAMRNLDPTRELYVSDGSHPSYLGSYLAAATIFSTVFRELPASNSYLGSADQTFLDDLRDILQVEVLSKAADFNLRNHGEQTVLKSLETTVNTTNLTYDLDVSFRKAQHISVDFGDGFPATSTNVRYSDLNKQFQHSYTTNQAQTLIVTAESVCNLAETTQSLVNGTLGLTSIKSHAPVTVVGNVLNNPDNVAVELVDISGKVLLKSAQTHEQLSLPSGVYFIQTPTSSQKIFVE